ncbi:MAG: hypothetical protein V3V13_07615 [Paracoccaceae bacterium]
MPLDSAKPSAVSLQYLDASVLMWNIRRNINRLELPAHTSVIQFIMNDPPKDKVNYWLVTKPGMETDLCFTDPGLNVDLFLVCELRALTSAWMGHTRFEQEIAADNITLSGHAGMAKNLTKWLVGRAYSRVITPACGLAG